MGDLEGDLFARFLAERCCSSQYDATLRIAVFCAGGTLTRPTLQWPHSAELMATGAPADFCRFNVAAEVGAELVRLVAAHLADLNAIRSQLLSRVLPPDRRAGLSPSLERDRA
jgi:hypothetical protein